MKQLKVTVLIIMLITICTLPACDNSGGGDTTVSVTGISINKTTAEIRINQTEQLTAIITPADASNQKVRWVSSDETVAIVSITGLVTIKAHGWATITAISKDGGFIAKGTVRAKYNLRDRGPAGGYIFYDKGSYSDGWRYLEAEPYSLASNMGFSVSEADYYCQTRAYGGYTDWFLPSMTELGFMYNNMKSGTDINGDTYTPVSIFYEAEYWSSSRFAGAIDYFNSVSFIDGALIEMQNIELQKSVRAVRSF